MCVFGVWTFSKTFPVVLTLLIGSRVIYRVGQSCLNLLRFVGKREYYEWSLYLTSAKGKKSGLIHSLLDKVCEWERIFSQYNSSILPGFIISSPEIFASGQLHLLHCENMYIHAYLFYICRNHRKQISDEEIDKKIVLHMLLN